MGSLQKNKIEDLYQFFLNKGFDSSLDIVSKSVNISKKTLFNQYLSRKNLEYKICEHWLFYFDKRLTEKMRGCNNLVEGLLLFIYEIVWSSKHERFLFEKIRDDFPELLIKGNNCLQERAYKMIIKGIEDNYFKNIGDSILQYTQFLILGIIYFYLDQLQNPEMIGYLLAPILNEEGVQIVEEIDLTLFFKI